MSKKNCNKGDDHEPVKLKGTEVVREGLFLLDVLNDGRNIIRVGSGVDRLNNNSCSGSTEHVKSGTDDRLVCFEVDAGYCKERGIQHAENDCSQKDKENEHKFRPCRSVTHHQSAAKGTNDHDTLETEVDDAGMFTEAAAESNENQNG